MVQINDGLRIYSTKMVLLTTLQTAKLAIYSKNSNRRVGRKLGRKA